MVEEWDTLLRSYLDIRVIRDRLAEGLTGLSPSRCMYVILCNICFKTLALSTAADFHKGRQKNNKLEKYLQRRILNYLLFTRNM